MIIRILWKREPLREIERRAQKLVEIKEDQGIQLNRMETEASAETWGGH